MLMFIFACFVDVWKHGSIFCYLRICGCFHQGPWFRSSRILGCVHHGLVVVLITDPWLRSSRIRGVGALSFGALFFWAHSSCAFFSSARLRSELTSCGTSGPLFCWCIGLALLKECEKYERTNRIPESVSISICVRA